jgi:hypothetical protein
VGKGVDGEGEGGLYACNARSSYSSAQLKAQSVQIQASKPGWDGRPQGGGCQSLHHCIDEIDKSQPLGITATNTMHWSYLASRTEHLAPIWQP